MARKIIKLEENILVEVEIPEGKKTPISGGKNITSTVNQIKPILIKLSEPIIDTCKEISNNIQVEQAEVEVSFGFEGEGNIYITKAKANANLSVKIILKPKK